MHGLLLTHRISTPRGGIVISRVNSILSRQFRVRVHNANDYNYRHRPPGFATGDSVSSGEFYKAKIDEQFKPDIKHQIVQ